MTGMQQVLMGGGAIVGFTIGGITDIKANPATAIGSITFNSNGTISVVGTTSSASPAWVSPATAGIGSSYWIRIVVNSGTAPLGSAVNTVLSLSGGQGWTWTSTAGQVKTANCTITVYADSGGTVALASATFPVDVEST